MTSIFDYINSIAFSKKSIDLNCEDESQFSSFMVNRWLSFYSPEISNYINETSNKQIGAFNIKQDQYNYIYNIIPKCRFKRIAYIKKTKKDKEEKEEQLILPEFLSKREYSNHVELLKSLRK